MASPELPYHALSRHLRERFGQRVHRVPLDGGFGCPNRDGTRGWGGCTFCDGAIGPSASGGRGAAEAPAPIAEQMRRGIERVRSRHGAGAFIAYFQRGTSTYGPPERIRDHVREALVDPQVVGASVATRPDCIDDRVLDALQEATAGRTLWIELGLPSANPSTLERVRRGHGVEEYRTAASRVRERGIPLCAHVVFGLPGETREDMIATVGETVGGGLAGIKIHNLYVVDGTEIARSWRAGEVRLPSLDEYASWVADALEILPPEVVIHRLTGEGSRERVLAPDWSFEKGRVLARIRDVLRERGSRQGSAFRIAAGRA